MAIVTLKKMTLCGLTQKKLAVLQALQEIGGLHLISGKTAIEEKDDVMPDKAQAAEQALAYLKQSRIIRHQVKYPNQFNFDQVISDVESVRSEIRKLSDQRDFLAKRIQDIEPWGDFTLPDNEQLGELKLWFYIIPNRLFNKFQDEQYVWKCVHKTNVSSYVVIVSNEEPKAGDMPVDRTHTGTLPLSELRKQLNDVELRLEDVRAQRESLTRWIDLLNRHLAEFEDRQQLQKAIQAIADHGEVFVLKAWIAENNMAMFKTFAKKHKLAVLFENPQADETPPTLLQNNAVTTGGEDIVQFYQTPHYREWDPSSVVFFSFALFFAMILSDAGYAALFAGLLWMNWQKLGLNTSGNRLRLLCLFIVTLSFLWGAAIGSYFGYTPSATSLAGKIQFLDINDFDSMMHISIVIGVMHIMLANLLTAWLKRAQVQAFAAVGWAVACFGGYLLWVAEQGEHAVIRLIAIVLLAIALLLIVFFSGSRALQKPADYFWRFVDGICSLAQITKIFGDVLSYMRLFALGLASASLALTFNQLAMQVMHSQSGLSLLSGLLILIIGHALNIILCLMSGVVHGLRLNFIEFYNWSVSEEGYPFKPFIKKGIVHE